MKSKDKPKPDKNKRQRGRPVEKPYPERIEASPEEIAEMVLRMPNKKRDEWRYLKE